jgi:hypothetical protein
MNIKLHALFGPKLEPRDPMEPEDVVAQLVKGTGLTKGNVLAVLTELDDVILEGLLKGQRVKLPNGMVFAPYGKIDGSIRVVVRLTKKMVSIVNSQFRGRWINAQNIGKTEEEFVAMYNEKYPNDPL